MGDEREAEAKRIGRLIGELRESRGMSQQDLAHELGVAVSTVSRWERGLHRGYAPNVRKLSRVLKVNPAALRPVTPDVESQLDRIEAAIAALTSRLERIEQQLSEPDDAERAVLSARGRWTGKKLPDDAHRTA